MKKKFLLNCIAAITFCVPYTQANALPSIDQAHPHFYLQLENQVDKPVSVRFISKDGNTYLNPSIDNSITLQSHEQSQKYQVFFKKLDASITFDIAFKSKEDCTFTIGYYAPGNPKISMSGLGCNGGGYRIIDSGTALLLYVSSMHFKKA